MHAAVPSAKSHIFAMFCEVPAEACIISRTPQDEIQEEIFGGMVRKDSESHKLEA